MFHRSRAIVSLLILVGLLSGQWAQLALGHEHDLRCQRHGVTQSGGHASLRPHVHVHSHFHDSATKSHRHNHASGLKNRVSCQPDSGDQSLGGFCLHCEGCDDCESIVYLTDLIRDELRHARSLTKANSDAWLLAGSMLECHSAQASLSFHSGAYVQSRLRQRFHQLLSTRC
jgi:hypothetical protein